MSVDRTDCQVTSCYLPWNLSSPVLETVRNLVLSLGLCQISELTQMCDKSSWTHILTPRLDDLSFGFRHQDCVYGLLNSCDYIIEHFILISFPREEMNYLQKSVVIFKLKLYKQKAVINKKLWFCFKISNMFLFKDNK